MNLYPQFASPTMPDRNAWIVAASARAPPRHRRGSLTERCRAILPCLLVNARPVQHCRTLSAVPQRLPLPPFRCTRVPYNAQRFTPAYITTSSLRLGQLIFLGLLFRIPCAFRMAPRGSSALTPGYLYCWFARRRFAVRTHVTAPVAVPPLVFVFAHCGHPAVICCSAPWTKHCQTPCPYWFLTLPRRSRGRFDVLVPCSHAVATFPNRTHLPCRSQRAFASAALFGCAALYCLPAMPDVLINRFARTALLRSLNLRSPLHTAYLTCAYWFYGASNRERSAVFCLFPNGPSWLNRTGSSHNLQAYRTTVALHTKQHTHRAHAALYSQRYGSAPSLVLRDATCYYRC